MQSDEAMPASDPTVRGMRLTRRQAIVGAAGLGMFGAGIGLLSGCRREPATSPAAEPPPETTRLRLSRIPAACFAPQYIADELLKAEGFTEVQYVTVPPGTRDHDYLAGSDIDIGMTTVGLMISWIDAGHPIVALAGTHSGCYELFGTDRVQTIRDLKGKAVAVPVEGGAHQLFLSSMAAHIGLNPRRDVSWVTRPSAEAMQLLADDRIDAYLGFPPEPQELRARKIGHSVVNTTTDKPWSQYYCCMVAGNREFVHKHPVATKRALRALLKGADICAGEPERVARSLVERGFAPRYDYVLQMLTDLPYTRWREYDPEDTVRFHTIRLQEAGLVKSSPKKVIAQGADWRFFNELKKELKT